MAKKKNGGGKKRTEKTLRQLNAKKNISNVSKANNAIKAAGKTPASQLQLFEIQKTLSARVDSSIMSTAAIAKLMVDKGLITWDDYKETYRKMSEDLIFIRNTTQEAVKHFGSKEAEKEDISTFIYEKAIAAGMDEGVLYGIFGVQKSKSRIIKPNQVKVIQPSR
jgi:hypothetical protein